MDFANDNHQEVFERVKTFLHELFDEIHFEKENGHFYVSYGSTVLEISVDPYGPEDALMIAMSYCVQDVEVDEELLRTLLELNHALPFGAFSLIGSDIFFSHSLLGRTLDRPNVLSAIAAVATVSDDYDDLIVGKWGWRACPRPHPPHRRPEATARRPEGAEAQRSQLKDPD